MSKPEAVSADRLRPRGAQQRALAGATAVLAMLPLVASAAAPTKDAPADSAVAEGPEAPDATEPPSAPADTETEAPSPPRVDGAYVGGVVPATLGFKRVMAFETPEPFVGGGAGFRAGDVVLDWMSIGFEADVLVGRSGSGQREAGGQLLIDLGFYPLAKRRWSIHGAFGFGAASVRDADGTASGFGGGAFRLATRYEFFPGASKYRPRTGGGMGIGPELGFLSNPPGRAGGPMSNTLYLALSFTWYRGR